MLDTQFAIMESHHGQTTSKTSNPLNLGESRWEEEITGGFHGDASKLEGKVSGTSRKREAGGSGGSGAGEAPGGDLGKAAAPLGVWKEGVNEGTGRVALTPTLKTQGETARAGVSGVVQPESPAYLDQITQLCI
jgi:hypothetical protein